MFDYDEEEEDEVYEENEIDQIKKELHTKIAELLQEAFVDAIINQSTSHAIKAKVRQMIIYYLDLAGVQREFDVKVEFAGFHNAVVTILDANGNVISDWDELFD